MNGCDYPKARGNQRFSVLLDRHIPPSIEHFTKNKQKTKPKISWIRLSLYLTTKYKKYNRGTH